MDSIIHSLERALTDDDVCWEVEHLYSDQDMIHLRIIDEIVSELTLVTIA